MPPKTCNWNCVYCQLGRSTPAVNERREYIPVEAILAEAQQALQSVPPEKFDWVTFVASGEGTLHTCIGELVRAARAMTDRPVAVITNGSTLHLPDVRAGLAEADAVLPTLDAGDAGLYRCVNRPHPQFSYEQHLAGLLAFAKMSRRAKLWIEVMLVGGLNDTDDALSSLAAVLGEIEPDEIHLTLPTRCPAETWVRAPDARRLIRAQEILGRKARLMSSAELAWAFGDDADLENQIVSVVSRHPLRLVDIEQANPHICGPDLHRVVGRLQLEGCVRLIRRSGETFVCGPDACFGEYAGIP
jgi:wyosine [tRNA(Phe)-imidazoG37] synthetase (radical SAM superfamily)